MNTKKYFLIFTALCLLFVSACSQCNSTTEEAINQSEPQVSLSENPTEVSNSEPLHNAQADTPTPVEDESQIENLETVKQFGHWVLELDKVASHFDTKKNQILNVDFKISVIEGSVFESLSNTSSDFIEKLDIKRFVNGSWQVVNTESVATGGGGDGETFVIQSFSYRIIDKIAVNQVARLEITVYFGADFNDLEPQVFYAEFTPSDQVHGDG